ncbi:AAA family ATPase [Microcoleus sp. FACHB-831]|uniref:WD40 domain-containing protein n=1 Tax=Microcoleus sp. FACHB-831 TaxID=2692827 RepID=UPI0018F03275|nr:AAA family ATPase [Microcoleus sp. FACHB-831]
MERPEDVAVRNERSLKTLQRAIALSQGRFSLILVRCNYTSLRERMRSQLQEHSDIEIRSLFLHQESKTLYSTIKAEIGEEEIAALMVFGLESVTAIDDLLTSTNQVRDEFRKIFSFPIVLWVNDEVLQKMVKLARDFHTWASAPIQFAIAADELNEFLKQQADLIFSKVLEAGSDRFLDNAAINLGVGANYRFELESACKELQSRGELEPALEASQQFILGRDAYVNNEMERSRQLYEQSLAFWQQNDELEKQACLLFHLGLWWRRYAVERREAYMPACLQAREHYKQCVEVLQQAKRPDLAAKFINPLAEVLQQLKQWDELETVAEAAVELHQIYPDALRLANAYALMAEAALAKSQWARTKEYAETALQITAQKSESNSENFGANVVLVRQHYRSRYWFLLAQAQQRIGSLQDALQNLENAKLKCKHEYSPQLYLRILEALRSLYFNQHRYLEAFNIKQEKLAVKHQYGFHAFIGAGRLQPQRKVINPALVPDPAGSCDSSIGSLEYQQATIAPEIVASGRKLDVDRLLERISRDDCKLTVIHGPSGVGKSSLVTAGLVPTLHQKGAIAGRNILPVVVQVYTNWEELGKSLAAALEEVRDIRLSAIPNSLEAILEQLRKNVERNLLTVLIFDQFEEFFFSCHTPAQRRKFWEFLHVCLDTLDLPYVKVILSLREDYVHYLFECDRLNILEITKNNILNKEICYPFGNLSPEDAKKVIRSLTHNSFYLETALIDELVRDLAGELDSVRPIELQLVGAQLQAENITTLVEYQQRGTKEKLVERFLEEVVKDCGAENERAAQVVLYFLTDENNTRPLKTRSELEADIEAADLASEVKKLDLVLKILVGSGLVFEVPQIAGDRYQLVHDYLVSFIRQQRGSEVIAEHRREKEQRQITEKKLTQLLKRQLQAAIAAGFLLAILAASAGGFAVYSVSQRKLAEEQRKRAETVQEGLINALSSFSESLFASNNDFDALIESVRAGVQLKLIAGVTKPDTRIRLEAALLQALYRGSERNRLQGHSKDIIRVSFSPDGKALASASLDGTLKLWSIDGKLLKTLKGAISISFSPDGKTLASASGGKTVKLWNIDGKLLKTLTGHSEGVWNATFSPDGKTIASAGDDKTVKLWSIDGKLLKTLTGHSEGVWNATFSPDGKTIASASFDKTVKLWSLDGKLLKTLTGHSEGVWNATFSPDGKTIASASFDKTVKLWSLDGKLLKTLTGHSDAATSATFSPDGKILASASYDKTVKLWSLDGKLLKTLTGHSDAVWGISFSPDGKTIASASSDKTVKLWSLDGKLLKTTTGHSYPVTSASFSPDGKTLASASYDKTVKLWSLDGKLLKTLTGHSDTVWGVSFSPDGKTLASAGDDKTVKLWSIDGKLLKTLTGHSESVWGVSFSPDGKTVASASRDKTVKLWSIDGKLLKTLTGHSDTVWGVSFSPDGKTIASASWDKTVKLWSVEGKLLKTLTGHSESVHSVTFSPDGKTLASASYDNTVKLWNVDGKLLKTLSGHSNSVDSVTFSPDGKTIASASSDKTVKLWSLDGKLLKTLSGYSNLVTSVTFSPDGKTLASYSDDEMVKLWNWQELDLDYLLIRGCDRVRDYLKNNSTLSESDRQLCDGIPALK